MLSRFLLVIVCCFQSLAVYADEIDFFEHNIHSSYSNQLVLLQNRNAEVGPSVLRTDLKMTNWVSLDDSVERGSSSIIGLTPSGRLYQYIEFDGNKFARRLSGTTCIRDFRVLRPGQQLAALGCDDRLYVYSGEVWARSPLPAIVKTRLMHSVLGGFAITVATLAYSYQVINDPAMAKTVGMMASVFGTTAYIWAQSALAFLQFGQTNERPDGLVDTGLKIKSFEQLDETARAAILSYPDHQEHWRTNCAALLKTQVPELAIRHVPESGI